MENFRKFLNSLHCHEFLKSAMKMANKVIWSYTLWQTLLQVGWDVDLHHNPHRIARTVLVQLGKWKFIKYFNFVSIQYIFDNYTVKHQCIYISQYEKVPSGPGLFHQDISPRPSPLMLPTILYELLLLGIKTFSFGIDSSNVSETTRNLIASPEKNINIVNNKGVRARRICLIW